MRDSPPLAPKRPQHPISPCTQVPKSKIGSTDSAEGSGSILLQGLQPTLDVHCISEATDPVVPAFKMSARLRAVVTQVSLLRLQARSNQA